jgi:hypothetical protein
MSDTVEAVLTPELRPLLKQLLALVQQVALEHAIPVAETYVDATINYETNTDEIVITQAVDLPADPALEYWRQLTDAVTSWRKSLPRETSRASRHFAVAVIWDTDGEEAF